MTEQSDEVPTPPITEFDKDYNLNKLTPEERRRIIKNILDGNTYKHIDVIENKNGTFRLTRKKVQSSKPLRKRKVIGEDDSDEDNIRVHLTPTQQLLEFAFEKIGKLEGKNKKRKQQLKEIYSLFNEPEERPFGLEQRSCEESPPKIEKVEVQKDVGSEIPKEDAAIKSKTPGIVNLRSRLIYLK